MKSLWTQIRECWVVKIGTSWWRFRNGIWGRHNALYISLSKRLFRIYQSLHRSTFIWGCCYKNSSPIFCSDEFCHKVFCLAQNSLVLHKVLTRSKALLDGFVDASSLMSLGVVRLDVGVVSDDSYKWGTVAIDGYWGWVPFAVAVDATWWCTGGWGGVERLSATLVACLRKDVKGGWAFQRLILRWLMNWITWWWAKHSDDSRRMVGLKGCVFPDRWTLLLRWKGILGWRLTLRWDGWLVETQMRS